MSEVSKVVFVAFTQHCIQSTVTHVGGVEGYYTLYTVASRPCQEGRLLCEPSVLGGLAVHHWSELKGAQQPGNSYISMGTKLHPPYPNQDCLPIVLI